MAPVAASKSRPDATRLPSSSTSDAGNSAPDAANLPSRSQYSAARNAMRARSRSTTRRVATLCTRPAESFGIIFFHSTGDSS